MDHLFAEAKTIRDIGSYLPVAFGGRPYDPEEHRRAVDIWSARSNGPLPPEVRTPEFFGNSLFDSFLLDLKVAEHALCLTVAAEDTPDFASALNHLLGRPRQIICGPIDLFMHRPTFVRWVVHDDSGTLMEIEDHVTIVPEDLACLNNEWFFPRQNGLGWVVDAYHPDVGLMAHLLVECASASAIDRRLETLVSHFGPAVAPLWHDARAHFDGTGRARLFWNEHDLIDYLPALMQHHGLSRKDFPSPGA